MAIAKAKENTRLHSFTCHARGTNLVGESGVAMVDVVSFKFGLRPSMWPGPTSASEAAGRGVFGIIRLTTGAFGACIGLGANLCVFASPDVGGTGTSSSIRRTVWDGWSQL